MFVGPSRSGELLEIGSAEADGTGTSIRRGTRGMEHRCRPISRDRPGNDPVGDNPSRFICQPNSAIESRIKPHVLVASTDPSEN